MYSYSSIVLYSKIPKTGYLELDSNTLNYTQAEVKGHFITSLKYLLLRKCVNALVDAKILLEIVHKRIFKRF